MRALIILAIFLAGCVMVVNSGQGQVAIVSPAFAGHAPSPGPTQQIPAPNAPR